jgi:hypothetical protein
MTFEAVAPIVDRSVVPTRQLASRARRTIGGRHISSGRSVILARANQADSI